MTSGDEIGIDSEEPLKSAEEWLKSALPDYERLSPIVASLIGSLLKEANVDYLSITSRTKTLIGSLQKIRRKEYAQPQRQLTDITGIRVIVYLERQTQEVANLIEYAFLIDPENSADRKSDLGRDRVGYRSLHYVCKLGPNRSKLPEYAGLADLPFEIQIRTVLQHAWAELAHDSTFKFDVELPDQLQRKLNLHAAMLEIVDGAFQEIQQSIEDYASSIQIESLRQQPFAPLDSLLAGRIIEIESMNYGISLPGDVPRFAMDDLRALGITTVGAFRELFSDSFYKAVLKHKGNAITKTGLIRLVLLYNKLEDYCRGSHSWVYLTPSTYNFVLEKYGEALDAIVSEHQIEIRSLDQLHAEEVAARAKRIAETQAAKQQANLASSTAPPKRSASDNAPGKRAKRARVPLSK